MTLTEFLLARIAEDEAVAREAYPSPWDASNAAADASVWTANDTEPEEGPTIYVNGGLYANQTRTARHIARHDPARVLAECEAKRRIVEQAVKWERMHQEAGAYMRADDLNLLIYQAKRSLSGDMLRFLALPYADHPDYDEGWRP